MSGDAKKYTPGKTDGGDVVPFYGKYDVNRINKRYSLVMVSGKAVIIEETPENPDGIPYQYLDRASFMLWFANRKEFINGDPVSWAKLWISDQDRRQYSGVEFTPAPIGKDFSQDEYFNLWRGFAVEPVKGNCQLYWDHILDNIAQENTDLFDWIKGFMAHMIQKPHKRPDVAWVIRGRQGTGKTTPGDILGSLVRQHYLLVDQDRYVTGQFNAHMATCLLLQADEAVWAGDKQSEGRLKGLVTAGTQMIEPKSVNPFSVKNYIRCIFTSNHDWVVPAGMEERRFCVTDISDARMQDTKYFKALYDQMDNGGREALLYDLLHYDLSNVDLRKVPQTQALFEQKLRSLDPPEEWWLLCLMNGEQVKGRGWEHFVPTDWLVSGYISHTEKINFRGRRSAATLLMMKLRSLVPGLGARQRQSIMTPEDEGVKRMWGHSFPPLKACRDHFSKLMRWEIEWGDG